MKLLFKYPTRQRHDWFQSTLEIYQTKLSKRHPFQFLITMDEDDLTMNNQRVWKYLNQTLCLTYNYGKHKTKIEAINADMNLAEEDWDILVLVSDDMIPIVDGYDDIIVQKMIEHFPDTNGALHFHDGLFGKNLYITLTIMGRKLYEYFGYIYHPDYKSFFCDAEFTDVAYQQGRAVYIPQVIIEHQWCGGPQSHDALYRRNSAMGKVDRKTYKRRKENGFPK